MKYLIVYGISNIKRLRKVAKYLEKIAIRVQNSTFELDKNIIDISIKKLLDDLKEYCEPEDKIFIYKIKSKEDMQQNTMFWEMVF